MNYTEFNYDSKLNCNPFFIMYNVLSRSKWLSENKIYTLSKQKTHMFVNTTEVSPQTKSNEWNKKQMACHVRLFYDIYWKLSYK